MAATRVYNGGGISTGLLAPPATGYITVLDWIAFTGSVSSGTITLQVNGVAFALVAGTTAAPASEFFDFSGGYPLWAASDTDSAASTNNPSVQLTGTGLSATLTVGYHWETLTQRRDANIQMQGRR